ncbi:MAG: UbiH/UbiF/VisC/COQ6 family ubiquinone biosynthesis hydroxylase [Rhodovibrionaceae bacterium]|nr:UbiH/UbiF/VisC/COQ6 family ubiquinone biosynthesis hydroxylase [Rhodovibrionaceae bacterium]
MARGRNRKAEQTEAVIVGGGMVGLSLGIALAHAGIRVAVLDREDPDTARGAPFDGRSSAIAFGTQRMLGAIGLWEHIAQAAQPILDIRVSDGQVGRPASPFFLHYDHSEVGQEPLGWIVENRQIRTALYARAAELETLQLLAPVQVGETRRLPGHIEAEWRADTGESGRVRASLLVAADGRGSRLRAEAGIRTTAWSYPQSGIVTTVAHEKPHEAVAHEHFLPSGPFAMLPMVDGPLDESGGVYHRSSIVWTERRELADAMMALDDDAFGAEIMRRFGDSLGTITASPRRWCYPLGLINAERYTDHRLALVGDAAHGIHPIAGQGLNLGLRGVAALAEAVVDARRLGLDIGAAQTLARYQSWRRLDAMTLIAVTDGLNRLFSNNLPPLRAARDLGLAAVDRVGPLKRFFMRHAMGVVGDLPRLIRGEPL